ncbi:MAG: class I SAM-dependent methyltransferase [Deltaproteobacteria bacterium]|nr:class I SAM-dependent methyltransferase [Deltaproteobacteria bacterium]
MLWRMISKLMVVSSPQIRRLLWRVWYDSLSKYGFGDDIQTTFLNYGYAFGPDDGLPPVLEPQDEPNRYTIQLYHHVAAAVDLAGCDVLEVASGRGGGAAYVMRYLKPRRYFGLDASTQAVAFTNRIHRLAGLEFGQGHAERLPFGSEQFDAVICVEASHCFCSLDNFLGEVRRVLRPGGHLLYCDLRPREMVAEWREALGRSGLEIVREREITPQVLAALAMMSDERQRWIERFPRPLTNLMASFAGVKGHKTYEGLRSGEFQYLSFTLQRPA